MTTWTQYTSLALAVVLIAACNETKDAATTMTAPQNFATLYKDVDGTGEGYEVATDKDDIGDFTGQASSIKVYDKEDVWVVFYSKKNHDGSELWVKGPVEIKVLGNVCKHNCVGDVLANTGNWNDEIASFAIMRIPHADDNCRTTVCNRSPDCKPEPCGH